jgi:hypothetical protein
VGDHDQIRSDPELSGQVVMRFGIIMGSGPKIGCSLPDIKIQNCIVLKIYTSKWSNKSLLGHAKNALEVSLLSYYGN